tara:strand:- start:96 stop:248 length:153 start_codon:yes stop_codon:yes gene_type:complete
MVPRDSDGKKVSTGYNIPRSLIQPPNDRTMTAPRMTVQLKWRLGMAALEL